MDSEEAMKKLKEGNARFASGEPVQKDLIKRREELVSGQKPYVVILTCSDSRVVPEYIFDANMGELFIIRNAGNIVDSGIALGSIEYGTEHLHAPLLLVLGHESCGAVGATCDCKGKGGEGHIKEIVSAISQSAQKTNYDKQKCVEENVKCMMGEIVKKSQIVAHLVHEKKLKIVGAVYSLSSGEVKFIA